MDEKNLPYGMTLETKKASRGRFNIYAGLFGSGEKVFTEGWNTRGGKPTFGLFGTLYVSIPDENSFGPDSDTLILYCNEFEGKENERMPIGELVERHRNKVLVGKVMSEYPKNDEAHIEIPDFRTIHIFSMQKPGNLSRDSVEELYALSRRFWRV